MLITAVRDTFGARRATASVCAADHARRARDSTVVGGLAGRVCRRSILAARGNVERDVQLVGDLVAGVPGYEDLYDAHVFNEGSVMSHLFFWEVVQETVSSFLGRDHKTDW